MQGNGTGSDPGRPVRPAPVRLHSLLNRLISERKWQRRLDQHAVFSFWEEAVGTAVARRAQPVVLRGDVLWVEVCDSVWMQQLHLQKALLLKVINARLPAEAGIADIRFQLAHSPIIHPGSAPATADVIQPPEQSPKHNSDATRLAEFKHQLAAVKNEEVRDALLSLWSKENCTE